MAPYCWILIEHTLDLNYMLVIILLIQYRLWINMDHSVLIEVITTKTHKQGQAEYSFYFGNYTKKRKRGK